MNIEINCDISSLMRNLIALYCSIFLYFYIFYMFYIFSPATMCIAICSAIYIIINALNFTINKYYNNGNCNSYFKKI